MNFPYIEDADYEEDDVAVEKVSSWYLHVHIHEKLITVACGDASQKVKWLAHVAIGKSSLRCSILLVIEFNILFLQRGGTRRTARAGRGWASPSACT